ncbi:hypothetical protein J4216_01600 [Candidatus Woesearchaeota archaeon]|nr:hypothetical protein [Candidatus Woesearchaeota archaeon]
MAKYYDFLWYAGLSTVGFGVLDAIQGLYTGISLLKYVAPSEATQLYEISKGPILGALLEEQRQLFSSLQVIGGAAVMGIASGIKNNERIRELEERLGIKSDD